MSLLNPERSMQDLKRETTKQIQSMFPIEGNKRILIADKVYTGDDEIDIDDVTSQKNAKIRGRTWSMPVYGDFRLIDKETGKTVATKKKMQLARLPHITRRYSFIVDGNEYQTEHQWRLKSGVYSRLKANGELEAQFNLAEGRGFRLAFDPGKRRYLLQYGTSNIPLFPALRALGVPEGKIRATLGPELYEQGVKESKPGALKKLAKSLNKWAPVESDEDALAVIREEYGKSVLRPDTTEITLGKKYTKVDGDVLLDTAHKLVEISRGNDKTDHRDSLRFKELWSIQDHIPERIKNSTRAITRKVRNNIDRKDDIRHIVTPDVFAVPVKSFFTTGTLAQTTDQTNPLDMVGSFLKTTPMGQGGIGTERAVSFEAKLVDSSYLGFMDSVHTPEGARTGVTGHLAIGVDKKGKEAVTALWSTKEKKFVERSPADIAKATIAFPDQYDWGGGEPKPKNKQVIAIAQGAEDPSKVAPKDVDYIVSRPSRIVSFVANHVPFMPTVQANRLGMADRHLSQAVSLKYREAPLVQSISGNPDPKFDTWEKISGIQFAHTAPFDGKVTKVTEDAIHIVSKDGKEKRKVALYKHFPLNDAKAFIHSEPQVKAGDEFERGDTLGDSSFTRDGALALGTNLRVGYLPYKGLNFEDGIVISETAAKQLTSEHLHKNRAYIDKDMTLGLKKYRAHFPGSVSDENAKKLDDDGVIKKGMRVEPGDTLVTALQKTDPNKEQLLLKGIHRSLIKPWKDKAKVWDKPYSGVVTDVVRNGREVAVYVKTEEPADIGDKLCFHPDHQVLTRRGWLYVGALSLDDELLTLNPETEKQEWVGCEGLHRYPGTHRLYYPVAPVGEDGAVRGTAEHPLMLVTPDHSIYADTSRGYKRLIQVKHLEDTTCELFDVALKSLPVAGFGREMYTGYVYCPTAERNHIILTKLGEGRPHWSGNSGRYGNKGVCYDPETEVLTDRGWFKFADAPFDAKFCTLNQKTHRVEYQDALRRIELDYEGDMYVIRGRRIDLMTTPEHKQLIRLPRRADYNLVASHEIFGKSRVFKRDGVWHGEHLDEVEIAPLEPKPNRRGYYLEPLVLDASTFLEFLGYFLTEGCVAKDHVSGEPRAINIAQRRECNPEVYQDIVDVIRRLGFEPNEYADYIHFTDKRLAGYLAQFGNSYEKFIPRWALECSSTQLQGFFETAISGDGGTYYREKGNHARVELYTNSKQLADDYQELALKIGLSANIKPQERSRIIELADGSEKLHESTEYVVRISYKGEVYSNSVRDSRYGSSGEWWEQYSGKVYCVEVPNHTLYVRRNGIPVWSGNCTAVIPDEEMPHNADGEPIHVLLGPTGVPGRINPGQILETSLGKLADEQGVVYAIYNFGPGKKKIARLEGNTVEVRGHYRTVTTKDGKKRVWIQPYSYDRNGDASYQEIVDRALQDNGVADTEELFDPATGKSLGEVLTGVQYMLKHHHQVDKKLSSRAHGYGFSYDANLQPKGTSGKHDGAQRFGELGLYAMLAHGAVHNIRDALAWKVDKAQDEVWTALQSGEPLPSPKPSFAYEKFAGYLNAIGLNIEKDGNEIKLLPLTDKQITEMSNGAITQGGKVIRGKDLKPEKGGLFDEEITGGPGGKNWSHIPVPESLPNPIFERAIQSLLGLKGKEYDAVINGEEELGGATGPAAVVAALGALNVDEALTEAEASLETARASELDRANKKVKYLRALKAAGMDAKEAYVLDNVPVLPPIFRPITLMEGGDLNVDGLNMLYRDVAMHAEKIREARGVLPQSEVNKLTADMYDAVDALFGMTNTDEGRTIDGDPRPPGILPILSGRNTPKQSFFHKRLLNRRQDLSMRSVIVPNTELNIDEIGIPRKAGMNIFRPFVVQQLTRQGMTPLQAREEIDKGSSIANRALDVVTEKRPVLFKRDPVLHKFGIQAFKARLHEENTIHIHPLTVGGFNADFDGDAMSVFVPVSQEAVDEAFKMLPSRMIFNEASGNVPYTPSLEAQLGLYLISHFGKKTDKKYADHKAALKAANDGDIKYTDVINVAGAKTTAGRIRLYAAIPEGQRPDKLLIDPNLVFDKKMQKKVFTDVGKEAPNKFGAFADKMKEIGFGHSYDTGVSFDLDDFRALTAIRDKHIDAADKKVDAIRARGLDPEKRDALIVDAYMAADKAIEKDARAKLAADGNMLMAMNKAGIKPGWAQLKQMILAPMLVDNAAGRTIPVPITRSYAEGLDTAGFWTATSGARKGLIEKVQSVQEPGALSKQIINTTIRYPVTIADCGTDRGVAMDASDDQLVDRFLARSVKVRDKTLKAGTAITPDLQGVLKAAKVGRVEVRSPLKCSAKKGMCGKCYGTFTNGDLPELGTNLGVIAGQAIGERGTQLSMKQFHMGGVAGSGTALSLDRVSQIMKMPAHLPGKATLATKSGKVDKVQKSSVGGYDVTIGGVEHYVPSGRELRLKVGQDVKKGTAISSGPIHPKELLELTNMDRVQRYMTDAIYEVYADQGVKKRNVEVVVKSLTNLARVEDPGQPGEAAGLIRGDLVPITAVEAMNKKAKSKDPIKFTPILRGLDTAPLDNTTDWIARLQYQRLKETMLRAGAEGWKSTLHGVHPGAGIAYGAEFGRQKKDEDGYVTPY